MQFILTKVFWTYFALAVIITQFFAAQSVSEAKLSQLTYAEMYTIYVNKGDRYLKEIFPLHIAKAKKEKDTLEWAAAYRYLGILVI